MPHPVPDLYKLLEVAPGCTDEDLRKSYCRVLLRVHPDLNPTSVEAAANKTREVLIAYTYLSDWRRAHSKSQGEVVDDVVWDREVSSGGFTIRHGKSGVSPDLNRIAALKQELRDAWRWFAAQQYDIKAALRLVRAAFHGERVDVVDDLIRNAKLVDAAPILAEMYSPDEAARIAIIWAQQLLGSGQSDRDLAIQLLQDIYGVVGISSIMANKLKDNLRSIHYGIAKGHSSGGQKHSPETRIVHLRAIVKLGFELDYIYKLLAEAFYEMGDENEARLNLQHAISLGQGMSAKTIMRALGLLKEEPRQKKERRRHLYTRPEHVPSAAEITCWSENEQWEQIIAHADSALYSPVLLPSARSSLESIASVLGECSDARAISSLLTLLNSVYWDVRQAALLALAKKGGQSELARLQQFGKADKFMQASVGYAEARLIGTSEIANDGSLMKAAEILLRTHSTKQYGEIGAMRYRLEQAMSDSEDARAHVLPILVAYCNYMQDWTRVRKLLGKWSSGGIESSESLELQIDLAAALVRGGMQSTALGCLHPIYNKLSQQAQRKADTVLWDALNSFEFIGPANYTWALRIVFKNAIFATNSKDLLDSLHRLARIMEPIGNTDMGVWLRHTLREAVPGTFYGDSHDRLNYFRPPFRDVSFNEKVE
jgi:hypothetical protein